MTTTYVNAHKDTVQKLANAYVETLNWIQTHTAEQITDKMPADYYAGTGKAAYVHALQSEKGDLRPERHDAGRRAADRAERAVRVQPLGEERRPEQDLRQRVREGCRRHVPRVGFFVVSS